MWEGGARRGRNRYKQHILPLHGGKGIYYGEIMIYVNGRRDVRLSKGWRYEPIMINAPSFMCPPSPPVHSSVTRGEALQHFSPSLHGVGSLQHLHHHTVIQPCDSTLSICFFLSNIAPSSSLLCCPSVVVYSM